MPTPIEALIDKACGYVPHDPENDYRKDPEHSILLQCSVCQRLIMTQRHLSDPKQAARIVFPCNRCGTGAEGGQVQYYDADGERVFAAWESHG